MKKETECLQEVLRQAATLTHPGYGTVRLVPRSVLHFYSQMERHTGQPFPHTLCGETPQALTLGEVIEHCGIIAGHDENTRTQSAYLLYEILTGSQLPVTHRPQAFIDDHFKFGNRKSDSADLYHGLVGALDQVSTLSIS